ncbi:hypothetical protein [Salinicola tamaricis]|uniref:hypothetical protein n=1 Tax=Salinicola tamaricis TaxID=1771309 RepID=UPI0013EC4AC8
MRGSTAWGEITAATGEQSQGIGQVNLAVAELDSVTQQNAAMVPQTAAAAASLQQESQRLAETVGAFTLDDTGGARRPALSHRLGSLAPSQQWNGYGVNRDGQR